MKKIYFVLFALIIFTSLTQAQEARKDTLEFRQQTEIVVTAPRLLLPLKDIPFAISIVGGDILNDMPRSISMDEPMKLVPGVKVDNQANGERLHLSMRGVGILSERGIRGIKTLLDGIPLNDPSGFTPDFYDIDFSNLQKIEVLKGLAASLYGGSSSGGIINIMSQNGDRLPLFGEGIATFGSNNFFKGFGRFGGTSDNVNYNVAFSRDIGDGYRQHTHFWGDKVYGKATYTPNKYLTLTPVFDYVDVYHENPEGIDLPTYNTDPKTPNSDAIPFNEYLETARATAGFTGNLNINNDHTFQFSAFVKRTLFTEANNHVFNHRTLITPGGSLQYTFNYGKPKDMVKNHFSVGSDLIFQNVDEHTNTNDHSVEIAGDLSNETINQRGVGVFAIDNVELGKYVTLSAGFRYDAIHNELNDLVKEGGVDLSGNEDFNRATGRFGITYAPLKEANLYASFGQGFLPPAIEELIQNPASIYGGFNTALTFATSNGFDAGVRGTIKDKLYYDVGGFYLQTKNDFERYRIPGRGQETYYANLSASKRIGVEVYGKYTPIKPLNFQVAYTFSMFKYDISAPIQVVMDDTTIVKYTQNDNFLPNSPQHQLMFDAQFNILPNFFIGVNTETYSKSYIDGANIEAEAVPGYTLIGARLGYLFQFKGNYGLELNIFLKNIADQKYVAFSEPDPGGNSYQPGAGREIFGSVKVHF
jgi:iron complex outermembrane receptor protein